MLVMDYFSSTGQLAVVVEIENLEAEAATRLNHIPLCFYSNRQEQTLLVEEASRSAQVEQTLGSDSELCVQLPGFQVEVVAA